MNSQLSARDCLLALAIVFVWGTNFALIREALDTLPPLLFAALRFSLVLLPAVFFLKRPAVPWRNLALYGTSLGFGQFGLLFIAMDGRISPGLASLVLQMQVFFTIALAMARNGERLAAYQGVAFVLALAGMAIIAIHNGAGTTAAGLALTLLAAASWALANQASRTAARVSPELNILGYVVWASLFAVPPLFLLSFLYEGWPAISDGMTHATAVTWVLVLWQSLGNTMFGFGCWAWLLSRYPAATIAPASLLVPVFGFAASALLLGEPLQSWKMMAAALVMSGLAINLLWPRLRSTSLVDGVRWNSGRKA
jgi:O-acetylserine/cysteine efflux transporter